MLSVYHENCFTRAASVTKGGTGSFVFVGIFLLFWLNKHFRVDIIRTSIIHSSHFSQVYAKGFYVLRQDVQTYPLSKGTNEKKKVRRGVLYATIGLSC